MSDTTKPAARVIVKTSPTATTPFAFRETKLRAGMVQAIQSLQPEGNPDPVQLENIRAYVLAEIAALHEDFNAVEVLIESGVNPGSRQANIIIFPKKF